MTKILQQIQSFTLNHKKLIINMCFQIRKNQTVVIVIKQGINIKYILPTQLIV